MTRCQDSTVCLKNTKKWRNNQLGSWEGGKPEVCAWIRSNFPPDSVILDVGACDGKWRQLLGEYCMDAVEAFGPNAWKLRGYRKVYHIDVCEFAYDWYDLIIFGDVIEHMKVEDAQEVLEYARPRCRDMIVSVPFLLPQGAVYGNPYEVHIQDDLTEQLFEERYPGFTELFSPEWNYKYYHKKEE